MAFLLAMERPTIDNTIEVGATYPSRSVQVAVLALNNASYGTVSIGAIRLIAEGVQRGKLPTQGHLEERAAIDAGTVAAAPVRCCAVQVAVRSLKQDAERRLTVRAAEDM